MITIRKKISPTLFINNALAAAFVVNRRELQKPIKRKEKIPIPSHPKNKSTKFVPATNKNIDATKPLINIKKVSNKGSCPIYT